MRVFLCGVGSDTNEEARVAAPSPKETVMECKNCKWYYKKLRRFMRLVDWCRKYDCKADYKCIDWEKKE